MRFVVAFALVLPLWAQDAREIVRRSLDRDRTNDRIARQYTFIQRVEERQIDAAGKVKKRESKTHDVTLLEGSPYTRLIARDDKPLSAKEEAKEKEKLARSIEERRKETEAERSRRAAEWEKKRNKQLEEMHQILDAFDLRLAGEDVIDGQSAWMIDTSPRPGYKPQGGMTRFFPKVKGRLWITKDGYDWVRAEAETIGTITVGGILARVHKGTRFSFEQTRVNDEVWLPKHVSATYSGRLALVKRLRGELDVTYRDYRKFQAESRIVEISEPVKQQ